MDVKTIGGAARAVGVSTKAIRLWESRGLIPKAERSKSGYRTFTDADLARLRFVRQAKTLGLTLGEIRDIIDLEHTGARPCGRVVQAIDTHFSAIDQSIADLLQLRNTLAVARGAANTVCGDVSIGAFCHIIEQVKFEENQSLKPACAYPPSGNPAESI
jgi:DNA-binding transcriptional MerR regulator